MTFFSINSKDKKINLIIFVHGSVNTKEAISYSEIPYRILDIKNKYYKKTKKARFNPNTPSEKFHTEFINFSTYEKGLIEIPIVSFPTKMAELMIANIDLIKKINQSEKKYYIYNWSGLLSHQARRKAGKILYKELKRVHQELSEKGYVVEITCIGYSHGGTVLVNMSSEHNENSSFKINTICFLGTPISKGLIILLKNTTLFKNVYNITSINDRIQRWDITSRGILLGRNSIIPSLTNIKVHNIILDNYILNEKNSHTIKIQHAHLGRLHKAYDLNKNPNITHCIPIIFLTPYIIDMIKENSIFNNSFHEIHLSLKCNSENETFEIATISNDKKKLVLHRENIPNYKALINLIKNFYSKYF